MAMTMQQFLVLAQADIDKIHHEDETPLETQYTKIFNVGSMDDLYDLDAKMAGFGTLQEIPEGDAVEYDEAIDPVTRRYDIVKFGLGYRITDKLWMNDRYGEVRKFEGDLRRADVDHTEVFAFGILNNATATTVSTGFDGLALASTAHTRLDGGPTWSNYANTALSLASLSDAVIAFKKFTNDRGRPYRSMPKTLLTCVDLEQTAEEILGSTMRPDTTNNAVNALRMYGLSKESSLYITATTFAALVGDKHDLNVKWRMRPKQLVETDFDTQTIKRQTIKWVARGHGEARGVYLIND
jgi:hypothetical protein